MLENLTLSGFFICYVPLALVIVGFIIFAGITDAHARRSYLRQMDLRQENERPEAEPLPIEQPYRTETPAGMTVTLTPEQGIA